MKLIHYSNDYIDYLENREYPQTDLNWQAKPNGLWFSIEEVEEYDKLPNNYNWKEWCEAERYRVEALIHSYQITLKDEAKILHLKTKEQILEFSKQYPLKTRDWDAEWDTYQLQWDEVKEKYQGIIIAPYQWDCRLSLESCWYYGWDCASGCIWDIDCIKSFNYIEQKEACHG